MYKQLLIIFLINLFLFNFASAQFHISEKKVNKSNISEPIKNYVDKQYSGLKVKYYELISEDDSILYEAKVKSSQGNVYLFFDRNSQFIRKDTQVHYHRDVPKELRKKISDILEKNVSSHKVTYCRHQSMNGQEIYELDVSVKKKIYRFRFEEDGTLIDYKEIPQKSIDSIFL